MRIKAGIIGAGNISGIYAANLRGMFSDKIELLAITDMSEEKARETAEKHGIEYIKSTDALLARDDIEIILNLTPPQAHFAVAKSAIEAGKHVYNEKPLCAKLDDGKALVELAHSKGVRLCCSPDTFLGAGLQTAKKLLDDGWIGRPVAGAAFLMNHGPEGWHPSPGFFYAPGGGPLFDMGPYYLTALVTLLGPIAAVSGNAVKSFETRTITGAVDFGKTIQVTTPTHISALLEFIKGASVTLTMSFDVWGHSLPHIEIYGSEGSMQIGDPNWHNSPVRLKRRNAEEWQEIPLIGMSDSCAVDWLGKNNWRGIGVAEMAKAINEKRPHKASCEQALHVLEVMTKIMDAGTLGKRLQIEAF